MRKAVYDSSSQGSACSRSSSKEKGKRKKTKEISELLHVPISKDTKAISKGKLKKLVDACELDADAIMAEVTALDMSQYGSSSGRDFDLNVRSRTSSYPTHTTRASMFGMPQREVVSRHSGGSMTSSGSLLLIPK